MKSALTFIVQWIPSFLRKTLNSCWPKTYGKKRYGKNMKNHGMVCPPPQNQRGQKPFGILPQSPFPIFWGLWGLFRHQMCPVTSGRVDNWVSVGQRLYACWTISGSGVRCAAHALHYRGLNILFPWWKMSRSVVSSHFRLILSREIMVPGPSSFFLTN